ncbi:MAG: hypothetical protein ACFFBD_09590 [Candidatus Hodarchaeota archaeon]
MINPLVLVLEGLSLFCLTVVSISLFLLYIQKKDLPPMLMGIAYSITGIIVSLYIIEGLFEPPTDFLGLNALFTKLPLLLLILGPSFMWLFKLEVFDDGIRANQLKVILYSFFTSIYIIVMVIDIIDPAEYTADLIAGIILLTIALMSYALGTYLISLMSILPKYENRNYRVKSQFLLLSLLAYIFCIGWVIIITALWNVFNVPGALDYDWVAWIGLALSSILAFFSFSIPKAIQIRLGLIESEIKSEK